MQGAAVLVQIAFRSKCIVDPAEINQATQRHVGIVGALMLKQIQVLVVKFYQGYFTINAFYCLHPFTIIVSNGIILIF